MDTRQRIHRLSATLLLMLAVVALLSVLSGYTLPRSPAPTDEGAAAHIFQLSVVAWIVAFLCFLASADWVRPLRNLRRLVLPAGTLAVAFAVLYHLEHYYFR
jgi:uncharacterized membrane protein YozB (DUF420 family)